MHNEYTPEEILTLLENGSSADDIAQSFTKALNDALEIQEKKEKEAKAAAEARKLADETRARAKAEAEEKARKLEKYYTGKLWKRDFAADEAGLLPPGLKRGVLSEDGVYNLLEALREPEKR